MTQSERERLDDERVLNLLVRFRFSRSRSFHLLVLCRR